MPTDNPWLTLIPAYSRDYLSADAVLDAWRTGKDFQVADVSSRWNGHYINEADAREHCDPATMFKIRYNRLEDFVLIHFVDGAWLLDAEEPLADEPWTPEDILRQDG